MKVCKAGGCHGMSYKRQDEEHTQFMLFELSRIRWNVCDELIHLFLLMLRGRNYPATRHTTTAGLALADSVDPTGKKSLRYCSLDDQSPTECENWCEATSSTIVQAKMNSHGKK